MSFYQENMKAIQNTRSLLYEKMQEMDLDKKELDIDRIKSIETKDGNLAMLYEDELGSYRLNSSYKPLAEAEKWASQFSFQNLNIIVTMFGLGNGIFAREMMKQLGEKDMLFILEPSVDIFLHTIHNYDITDILNQGRVSITVDGVNSNEFVTLVNECINWTNLGSQIKCVHPQYDKVFTTQYENFTKRLKDAEICALVNKNTEAFWGTVMTQNELKNIKYLKECNIVSDFIEDISPEVPVIIVSAGPSLDKNIEELKHAKGKSVIMSTDSALKYLFAHDIIPDLVITLDATKAPFHFTDERFRNIPLLCKTVSNPEILTLHEGKKIFFYNEEFIRTIFQQLGKQEIYYQVGGSVSTAAFSVCVGLGFKRIVFIGQDLCFHGDVTHAGGTVHNAHGSGEGASMMVEDIYGNMVRARYDWYTYLLWFQDAISQCTHIDVIDATEGGAKIQGTKIMTLAQVIDDYCNVSIDMTEIANNKKPTFSKEEFVLVIEYFKNSKKDLEQIGKKAKEAADICDRLIQEAKRNNIESYTSQELVRKISKYNKQMIERSIYQLINDYIAHITTKQIDTINQFTGDKKDNQIKTYTKAREVYKAIAAATIAIKPLLEESIQVFEV